MTAPVLRDLARRFFAGVDLAGGLRAVRALNAQGIKGTLNYVGIHCRSEIEAASAAAATIESLRRIHEEELDSHVSIKLTNLGLDLGEPLCRRHLLDVLDTARELGNFVRIDMEESPYVETTLRLFEEMRQVYGPGTVGIVVQSYLRHRRGDLDRLLAGGSRIRLVKGGYWESPDVVFRDRREIDAAFRHDLGRLLNHGRDPAIATHDAGAIACALQAATAAGLTPVHYEFQMAYGVREDLQHALVSQGYRVRCYVPYGERWYTFITPRFMLKVVRYARTARSADPLAEICAPA